MKHFDAIIIGSGQAGFPLAGALSSKGWKVALAETSDIGGTCINSGCSPTKTIIASARVAHMARRSADFGVQTQSVTIDWLRIMERKNQIIQRFRSGVEQWLQSIDNLTIYRQFASFEGTNRVRVGDKVIEADRIYINTGTRPVASSIPGLESIPYLNNATILDLKAMPENLVIIGGGYIGLEYAQAFQRFGSQVTVIQRSGQLLPHEDTDISDSVKGILENESVRVLLNTKSEKVEQRNGGIVVTVEQDGQQGEISGSHLLMATGRRPNSDRLNLMQAGVETDERGYIHVDDHLQTNVPGIWALGDVNGRGAFTHTSYNDYEIVLDNLNGGQRKLTDRIPAYAVYVDPPLGRVGMTEQQVRDSGRKALIAIKPMSHISRAIERDETQGFIKVLVDAESQQFLGAGVSRSLCK